MLFGYIYCDSAVSTFLRLDILDIFNFRLSIFLPYLPIHQIFIGRQEILVFLELRTSNCSTNNPSTWQRGLCRILLANGMHNEYALCDRSRMGNEGIAFFSFFVDMLSPYRGCCLSSLIADDVIIGVIVSFKIYPYGCRVDIHIHHQLVAS